jgi:hypothetical protein
VARPINVDRPTATRFGTVLIPFQAPNSQKFVVELSLSQWRALAGEVRECFARIDHEMETGRAVLNIERHESVT